MSRLGKPQSSESPKGNGDGEADLQQQGYDVSARLLEAIYARARTPESLLGIVEEAVESYLEGAKLFTPPGGGYKAEHPYIALEPAEALTLLDIAINKHPTLPPSPNFIERWNDCVERLIQVTESGYFDEHPEDLDPFVAGVLETMATYPQGAFRLAYSLLKKYGDRLGPDRTICFIKDIDWDLLLAEKEDVYDVYNFWQRAARAMLSSIRATDAYSADIEHNKRPDSNAAKELLSEREGTYLGWFVDNSLGLTRSLASKGLLSEAASVVKESHSSLVQAMERLDLLGKGVRADLDALFARGFIGLVKEFPPLIFEIYTTHIKNIVDNIRDLSDLEGLLRAVNKSVTTGFDKLGHYETYRIADIYRIMSDRAQILFIYEGRGKHDTRYSLVARSKAMGEEERIAKASKFPLSEIALYAMLVEKMGSSMNTSDMNVIYRYIDESMKRLEEILGRYGSSIKWAALPDIISLRIHINDLLRACDGAAIVGWFPNQLRSRIKEMENNLEVKLIWEEGDESDRNEDRTNEKQ